MNASLQRLRAEIRFDRDAFARRIDELARLGLSDEVLAEHAQAAVALHHAYGAIEATMHRIAREIDGDLPGGGDWHQALLHTMGLSIESVRPALLSRDSVGALRDLLGFRHFFRHAYAVDLDPTRLGALRQEICTAAPRILAELGASGSQLGRLDRPSSSQMRQVFAVSTNTHCASASSGPFGPIRV